MLVVPLSARAGCRRTPGWVVVAAAVFAGVCVDTCLEAEPVDVVGNCRHTPGPVGRVDRDVAGSVARSLPPTLVDVDVLIPGCLEAARNHRVGLPLDNGVVDSGGKTVPRRPSHGRSRVDAYAAISAAGVAKAATPSPARAAPPSILALPPAPDEPPPLYQCHRRQRQGWTHPSCPRHRSSHFRRSPTSHRSYRSCHRYRRWCRQPSNRTRPNSFVPPWCPPRTCCPSRCCRSSLSSPPYLHRAGLKRCPSIQARRRGGRRVRRNWRAKRWRKGFE